MPDNSLLDTPLLAAAVNALIAWLIVLARSAYQPRMGALAHSGIKVITNIGNHTLPTLCLSVFQR